MFSSKKFNLEEMASRLQRIRLLMNASGFDALIVGNQANVRYATGFRGEPHTLLLTTDEATLYTSFRSLPWAEEQTQVLESELQLSTVFAPKDEIARRLGAERFRIGVDRNLSHWEFLELSQKFSNHRLEPATVIERCRSVKSSAEIELLEHSQRVNESIFEAVIPQIELGMSERVVQGLMLAEMARREEVDRYSFAPIVAVAGNAWEIHHLADDTKLGKGEMLLLDLGVVVSGYASDMTRTLCLGKASDEMREVYDLVGKAQEAAIASLRPGRSTHEVDAVAREIITGFGHGRSFTHGLGHSIGLETHDPGLNLSQAGTEETLAVGMAFTVEPGVYLPDAFGVRTEDVVIVGEDGPRNLTEQSQDLLELNL